MRTIKWGILGLGKIAHKFAEGLKYVNNARLYAVGSRTAEKAENFANKYMVEKFYGSYEELAKDSDVDIIYIATPHNLHCENTIMCLENKKAVLCEKPFAINSNEVDKMIKSAKENKVFFMEGMWTRFLPHIEKIIEMIDSGKIGKPKTLFADFGFKADYLPEERLFNNKLGGGSLLDIGIYPVFLSLLLFGKPDEIKALANIGETDVDESCGIIFKYDDGRMSVLHSTIIADTNIEAEIFGTKMSIKINPLWFMPTNIVIKKKFKKPKGIHINTIGNGYNYEAEEATQCLLNNKLESERLTLSFSRDLISLLDQIRKKCGIIYPEHDIIT